MNNLADKIKEYRKANGLTQEELGKKLFVSRQAVSKWEQGRGYPSLPVMESIAELFGVTLDELISSEENKVMAIKANAHITKSKNRFALTVAAVALIIVICISSFFIFSVSDKYKPFGLVGFYIDLDGSGSIDLSSPDANDIYGYGTQNSGRYTKETSVEVNDDFTAYERIDITTTVDYSYYECYKVYLVVSDTDGAFSVIEYDASMFQHTYTEITVAEIKQSWFRPEHKYRAVRSCLMFDSYDTGITRVGRDILVRLYFTDNEELL